MDTKISEVTVRASPQYRAIDMDVRTRSGASRRLVIDVIGAPVDDIDSLVATQTPKAFDGLRRRNRSTANFGSYVVVVRMGDFRAVLLGDAPARRTQFLPWQQILSGYGVSFVKVSHHGAIDGTSTDLVSLLTNGMDTRHPRVAAITPFHKQKLPRPGTIDLLGGCGFEIKVSGSFSAASPISALIEQEFGIGGGLAVKTALSQNEEVTLTSFRV